MASEPYNLKWGIMATGWIAEVFCKDLLTNPATRSVTDVRHTITAVASSSGSGRAASFLKDDINCHYASDVKTYGTYAKLVEDPNVDIIYVATPHSHHFQNVMLALEAGKHVLCEKAFTVTQAQLKKLVDKAREKGLFLMEAVWTRYFPMSIKIRELVKENAIGDVHRVTADLSINGHKPEGFQWPDSHRMVNTDLAGGALLDLGIYSLTWVFQILYHLQPEHQKEVPNVVAAINKYPSTGADENTAIVVSFPGHRSVGIATTSILVGTDPDGHASGGPAIRIQGSKGEIAISHPAYKPEQYKVIRRDGGGKIEVVDCPFPKDPERGGWGHGMYWEADECARCLRDGKQESETLPLEESIVMMGVMEEALRQGGVKYPDIITSDVYERDGQLNSSR